MCFLLGCSSQELSKTYNTDKNWDAEIIMTWDDSKVIGEVKLKYKNNTPIKSVIIEPEFYGGNWPEGYYPPNTGTYTWFADDPEGAIPDVCETYVHKTSTLNDKPPKIMSKTDAANILNHVKVNIKWQMGNGEKLSTTIGGI